MKLIQMKHTTKRTIARSYRSRPSSKVKNARKTYSEKWLIGALALGLC